MIDESYEPQDADREPGFSELCWLLERDYPRALQEGTRNRYWSDFHRFFVFVSNVFFDPLDLL